MAFNMERLLVVDVEATCWEDPREQAKHNQEIIEIGIVEVDLRDMSVIRTVGSFVQPPTSRVSEFCTKLTGIFPDEVRAGMTFENLCEWLRREFKSHHTAWASWGDFDRLAFERQCKRENVRFPWGRTHLNAKALFSIAANQKRQVGVSDALGQLDWSFEGSPHRALDDAKNISRIVIRMLTLMRMNFLDELDARRTVGVGTETECVLSRVQREQRDWADYNFGDVPLYHPLLGAVEEIGELAHAHLKEEQKIRVGANHEEDAKDAVADTLIFLTDYCTRRGWDIAQVVGDTWDDVKQRDWKKYPETGFPPGVKK